MYNNRIGKSMRQEETIHLFEEHAALLEYYCEEYGLQKDLVVQEALLRYFDFLESQITEGRIGELKERMETVLTPDEVWDSLGIE